MKLRHVSLFVASALIVAFLLGGGLFVRVGAAESSYRQAVLFAEVLSLVLDNYVDPVEAQRLLDGAYEGMLAGLDPNGAYLSPEELAEWKSGSPDVPADPGFGMLKLHRYFQVVSVDPDSPAELAGVEVGDQIRQIAGIEVKALSLSQARRKLAGKPGTKVAITLVHAGDGLERTEVELERSPRKARTYRLDVRDDVAVLRIFDLTRLPAEELASELDDVRSRGIESLLLDLRNLTGDDPRKAAEVAGMFGSTTQLRLRDRSGRLLESVESSASSPAWDGSISVLINGATAEGAEALAALVGQLEEVRLFGESTYGLGAEARLFELENGAALLVSSALWETATGESWNEEGLTPDEVVRGEGEDLAEVASNQLDRVLEMIQDELQPEEKAA